jgi:hypothetical protein
MPWSSTVRCCEVANVYEKNRQTRLKSINTGARMRALEDSKITGRMYEEEEKRVSCKVAIGRACTLEGGVM